MNNYLSSSSDKEEELNLLSASKSIINIFKEELNVFKAKLDQAHSSIDNFNQNSIDNLTYQTKDELIFFLNWQSRDKLIEILNGFTYLLNGGSDDGNLIHKTNNLILYIADLPLKLDDNLEKEKMNSSNSQIKPTLILNSKLKSEISDLLIKNKTYSIQLKESINKDIKSNLIKENSDLILKLLNIPVQMIDDSFNDNFVWKKALNTDSGNKDLIDKQATKKLEERRITNDDESIKIKKIVDSIIKELPILVKKEVTFFYELDLTSFHNQDYTSYHRTPLFSCLGLDWNIKITYLKGSNKFDFSLVLLSRIESNKECKADCKLLIFNQLNINFSDNIDAYLENIYSSEIKVYPIKKCDYDDLMEDGFIKDDKIVLSIHLKADWI